MLWQVIAFDKVKGYRATVRDPNRAEMGAKKKRIITFLDTETY